MAMLPQVMCVERDVDGPWERKPRKDKGLKKPPLTISGAPRRGRSDLGSKRKYVWELVEVDQNGQGPTEERPARVFRRGRAFVATAVAPASPMSADIVTTEDRPQLPGGDQHQMTDAAQTYGLPTLSMEFDFEIGDELGKLQWDDDGEEVNAPSEVKFPLVAEVPSRPNHPADDPNQEQATTSNAVKVDFDVDDVLAQFFRLHEPQTVSPEAADAFAANEYTAHDFDWDAFTGASSLHLPSIEQDVNRNVADDWPWEDHEPATWPG